MSESTIFKEAKEAVRQGDDERARDLLSRLLRNEKNNPEYWLWMSSVVYSLKEKIFCLKNVVNLDPDNITAKRGLILLGGIPADDVEPSPPVRRAWQIDLGEEELHGWQKVATNPVFRIGGVFIASVIVLGLIMGGILGTRGVLKPRLTITPIAWTSTPTRTATEIPYEPTTTLAHTPTPKPLWMLLDATYTPTPLYVNTPHTRLEAYRLAIRAYSRGDYSNMISFLKQTLQDEPEAVDVLYYLGEAYKELGDYETAFQYYDEALLINQDFAPAYLSRAQVRRTLNPSAEVLEELDRAIAADPLYGEAYYERAIYWYTRYKYESALEDLTIANDLMPLDPRVYQEYAKVYLATGEDKLALENAREANRLDITILEGYLILGKAYLANNFPEEGKKAIETYGLYRPDDPEYLVLMGATLYQIGEDYQAALAIFDRAIELDNDLVDAFYYRGLTAYALGDMNRAMNDFFIARNLVPENLEYSVWFGIALYEDERYREAYNQFEVINPVYLNEKQATKYYYYKAKSGMALSLIEPVKTAWLALLDMPEGSVPVDWIREAEEYLSPPTTTPSPTATPVITKTSISTPTITSTVSTTGTNSPSLTPSYTTTPTSAP